MRMWLERHQTNTNDTAIAASREAAPLNSEKEAKYRFGSSAQDVETSSLRGFAIMENLDAIS